MDVQRKDHIDTKGPNQRNGSKQQKTHNLSTDDVENSNSTSKERDSLLANKPRLFPEEQKGCCKGCIAALLYIDQHILNESKTRRKNPAMAWIDYKKAYNMIPQS